MGNADARRSPRRDGRVIATSDALRLEAAAILAQLLDETQASRTTLRVDLPERSVSVQLPLAEARAEGVPSMLQDGSIDQRAGLPSLWMEKHRKPLFQEDLEHAEPAPPRALLDKYGAKAQMLAPVEEDGAMIGWVSVHHLPGPREWTAHDRAALESAVARITHLLKGRR